MTRSEAELVRRAQERVRALARGGGLPVLDFVLREFAGHGALDAVLDDLEREFPGVPRNRLLAVLARLSELGWLEVSALVEGRVNVPVHSSMQLGAALGADVDWQVPAESWDLDMAMWEAGAVGLTAPMHSQLRLLEVRLAFAHESFRASFERLGA